MSEPKRYEPSSHYSADFGMAQSPVGKWVSYEDYARLKAEVERLEKEVWRMKVFKGIDEDTNATLKDALNTVPEWAKVLETEAENTRLRSVAEDNKTECEATRIENARLKAEVERLTKAGDAMMGWIDHQHDDSGYPHSEAWEDAKGVQS